MDRVYLDNNSSTFLHEGVKRALRKALDDYGNPSALHTQGRHIRNKLEQARNNIREYLGADESYNVVFTSGATEANNIVLESFKTQTVFITEAEHSSVLESPHTHLIEVNQDGVLDLNHLEAMSLQHKPSLVSVVYANNEIGTIQPVKEAVEIVKCNNAIIHSDLSQGVGKVPINIKKLGLDIATISGHKIGAGYGIGAIIFKSTIPLKNIHHGGKQEYTVRPGTHNVFGIIAIGEAMLYVNELIAKMVHTKKIRDALETYILKTQKCKILGYNAPRVPNTTGVAFDYFDKDLLLAHFDILGIDVGGGSACYAGYASKQSLVSKLTKNPQGEKGFLRISWPHISTKEQLLRVKEAFNSIAQAA